MNRDRNRSFAAVWGLIAGASAIVGGLYFATDVRNGHIGAGLVVLAVFGGLTLGPARYAFGCARAGLLIDRGTVVIRNPGRTRELPLSDVHRFVAGRQPNLFGNPTPGVIVEVEGGRAHPVWTLAREGLVWNTSRNVAGWADVTDSLNELVSAR
jgi:hypothetical protein